MVDVVDSWTSVSQSRALLYRWFSNLLSLELTQEQVQLYQSGQLDGLYESLGQTGLEAEVKRVRQAVAAWPAFAHLRIELAADFAQQFLLDAKSAAIPYASAYQDEKQMYGSVERLMRDVLRENCLEIPREFNEPADHLAVILATMAQWIEREQSHDSACAQWRKTVQDQYDFVQKMLLVWLPEFARRSQLIPTSSDFYPAITQLLLAFVTVDADYLLSCLQDDGEQAD
ncbi:molecular chaperone TorD [Advenella sp. WQ 585]|uniref:Molecular chaperone TorD n=1 Tax=Advenella mandrilli TaxID=2800330 RepID=A0ABS1EAP5_9BURK|nr:molecular chaperone TorD [Advenella mandrilli]MBK1780931.1 molecular chaperone TorD [Advenella mandrilli]